MVCGRRGDYGGLRRRLVGRKKKRPGVSFFLVIPIVRCVCAYVCVCVCVKEGKNKKGPRTGVDDKCWRRRELNIVKQPGEAKFRRSGEKK